jgi:acyl-CoA thioesterase II
MKTEPVPDLLQLEALGDGRYRAPNPGESPEQRDVVFGGQILAQMIMASDQAAGGAKDVKSIHAIFARAGTYQQPIELQVERMQAGRTWASDTVTATQGDRLIARSLVLLSIDDPDLMRHQMEMLDVPGPADAAPVASGMAYPGAELRRIDDPTALAPGGVPAMYYWTRYPGSFDSPAVNQAILSWTTDGFFIELAMRPHTDKVRITDAHRSISTGVIGHTINFHERFAVGDWLLLAHEATYAGRGRIHGRALVYTESGRLVATFSQDSMVRSVEGGLDPKRSM